MTFVFGWSIHILSTADRNVKLYKILVKNIVSRLGLNRWNIDQSKISCLRLCHGDAHYGLVSLPEVFLNLFSTLEIVRSDIYIENDVCVNWSLFVNLKRFEIILADYLLFLSISDSWCKRLSQLKLIMLVVQCTSRRNFVSMVTRLQNRMWQIFLLLKKNGMYTETVLWS